MGVITKKGETRVFLEEGRFVIYGYEKDGKVEDKVKLVLLGPERKEYFLIPLRDGKKLMVPAKSGTKEVLKNGRVVTV